MQSLLSLTIIIMVFGTSCIFTDHVKDPFATKLKRMYLMRIYCKEVLLTKFKFKFKKYWTCNRFVGFLYILFVERLFLTEKLYF